MKRLLKSSFTWQFLSGFALGAVGLFALVPAQAELPYHPTPIEQVR